MKRIQDPTRSGGRTCYNKSMSTRNFITPHVHIQSLDTASTPKAFMKREQELGTGHLTCTDHGTLQACRTVYDLARKNGLKPILGLEGYFRDENDPLLVAAGIAKDAKGSYTNYWKYGHITLHALDQEAFETLIRVTSRADLTRSEKHGSERKPLFNWADLEELGAKNMTVGSSCLAGMVQRHLVDHNDPDMAAAYYEKLRATFKPGNFIVEVFPHVCDSFWQSGCVVTWEDGTTEKFAPWKKFKTERHGDGQIKDLATKLKGRLLNPDEAVTLLGVMENRKWVDCEPRKIIKLDFQEGFIKNQCVLWHPDGDLQLGCNQFMLWMAEKHGDPVVVSDDSHFAYSKEKVIQDIRLQSGGGAWKFAGCFEGGALVDMANGSKKYIKDVVEGDMVKSYDFVTKRVIAARVNRLIPSAATEEDFVAHEFLRCSGPGQRKVLVSTPNHCFWDGNQWMEISKCEKVSVRYPRFTNETLEAVAGMLLGDGCISLAGRHSDIPEFAYGHCQEQKILSEEAARLLGGRVDEQLRGPSYISGKPCFRQSFYSTTSAHPVFAKLRKEWYPHGTKTVPQGIILTPRTLAWWFMDDGTRRVGHTRGHGIPRITPLEQFRLYTNGFSLSSVQLLVSKLLELGIRAKILQSHTGPVIYFRKNQSQRFQALISPYIPPELQYKLSPEYRNRFMGFTSLPIDGEDVYPVALKRQVTFPKNSWLNRKQHKIDFTTKFDLEIDGSPCFFVNGLLVHNSYHRQDSAEAFGYFSSKLGTTEAEFAKWVDNSYAWASRFDNFELKPHPSLPVSFYPKDTFAHTMKLIEEQGRMDWNNPVWVERLASEIKLLHQNGTMDWLPYFFLAQESIEQYDKRRELTGPGRGSAAGLLLTYLLGITHVEPLRYNLSKERFLTLTRIKSGRAPDIDIDFNHRDILVGDGTEQNPGWLKERFGDCFAQLSVDTTLKLRSAVRDVARVTHGHVPEDANKWAACFDNAPQGIEDRDFVFGYKGSDGSWTPGSIETDEALIAYTNKYPAEWESVQCLLGLTRSKGRHASAFVITDTSVADFIPLTLVSDVPVTAYTAKSVEASGGLKMDFLVVNSLKDIRDCICMIQTRHGGTIENAMQLNGKRVSPHRIIPLPSGGHADIWDLPEDQAVFRDFCESKTETVFQFNTSGAVQWLREFNYVKSTEPNGTVHKGLDSIEGLSAFTALDRPGPLDYFVEDSRGNKHNMLVEYAHRIRGEKPIGNFPILDELLPETNGCIIYQEQLQRIFQHIGQTTAEEADEFRVHVGKKMAAEVIKDRVVFDKGAIPMLGKEQAAQLWNSLETFAAYGFNKSHSVAYVHISYACAYLKHYYPLEWWTAVLRNADKNEINDTFWKHCGHLIDLPDVNLSEDKFEIRNERIRAPVTLLMGIGEKAHQQLCAGRPYASIDDFCEKIEAFKKTGTTPVLDEQGKPVMVENKKTKVLTPKVRAGHSALSKTVVGTLIVSDAMDSLFPSGTGTVDQLGLYFAAAARAAGKKKVEPVPEKYLNLDTIIRFQMRKTVLASYSEPLLPHFEHRKIVGFSYPKGKERAYLKVTPRCWVPFVTGKEIDLIESLPKMWSNVIIINSEDNLVVFDREQFRPPFPGAQCPQAKIKVAVAAYIMGQRKFTYQGHKRACELMLDIDETRLKVVRWPDYETHELPPEYDADLKGAVIIAQLSKREGKVLGLDEVTIVQQPLKVEKEEA